MENILIEIKFIGAPRHFFYNCEPNNCFKISIKLELCDLKSIEIDIPQHLFLLNFYKIPSNTPNYGFNFKILIEFKNIYYIFTTTSKR